MRDAFFNELENLFASDSSVIFITGDLGYKLFDRMKEIDPNRVINFGVREAGMVGFAAGLAKTGFLPFAYSIAPFITLRCLEHIKIDLCYNNLRVVLVGVGGGMTYGTNGPTHHGIDDIAVLSCLPNLRIWTPADPMEVRACVRTVPRLAGPAYLRLGRQGEPNVHDPESGLPNIDAPVVVRTGDDGIIIAAGFILHQVLAAAEHLKRRGIAPTVIQIPTFRPFPYHYFAKLFGDGMPVMTVETSIASGGLGHEIARILAQTGTGNPFAMLTLPHEFPQACMDRDTSLEWAGLDPVTIARDFEKLLKR
jgi:transketolase